MFIQTADTPNPATLKFLPGQKVLDQGSRDFKTAAEAKNAPLAKTLFAVPGVAAVFLGTDFITVTKDADKDWSTLKVHVLAAIMDHFLSGLPAVMETEAAPTAATSDSDTVKQIRDMLDTRIRPAVAQDGGDIIFDRFEDGVVYLQMQGSCSGCPSSTATLKSGIENMLRHYIPEVKEVRQVAL